MNITGSNAITSSNTIHGSLVKGLEKHASKARLAADLLGLLSAKPCIFVANYSENQLATIADNPESVPAWVALNKMVMSCSSPVLPICGTLEHQLLAVAAEAERQELLDMVQVYYFCF